MQAAAAGAGKHPVLVAQAAAGVVEEIRAVQLVWPEPQTRAAAAEVDLTPQAAQVAQA